MAVPFFFLLQVAERMKQGRLVDASTVLVREQAHYAMMLLRDKIVTRTKYYWNIRSIGFGVYDGS